MTMEDGWTGRPMPFYPRSPDSPPSHHRLTLPRLAPIVCHVVHTLPVAADNGLDNDFELASASN